MKYDIIVIGAGPGGYSAAVTGSALGAKVLLVEKNELGGICVNSGCIPTKTILRSAVLYNALREIDKYGIKCGDVTFDYRKIIKRVNDVIFDIKKGIRQVLNAGKVDLVKGTAEIISGNVIKVDGKEINTKNVIIATGSNPKALKNFPFDNNRILSSESFLGLNELPKSVLIAGAGVIGCEWACILASFGVSVTLVEMLDKILPEEDSDLTRVVEANMKKMGINIKLNTAVENITEEKAMICIGRDPIAEGMDILERDNKGWIKADEYTRTNIPGIFAVGDISGPPLLAYTADEEGRVAAHNAMGHKKAIDYSVLPRVVFSFPEIASVGLRERESKDAGVVRAYFKGNGKALTDGQDIGFVKIIYDRNSYKILGVGIAGENAGELIGEAVLAIKTGITARKWAEVIRPHPVLSEIYSAALDKINVIK